MVLAPEHPLVDALTADAWPEGTNAGVDRRRTRRPAEAVGAYRAAAARRSELDRQAGDRAKTGVFTGSFATNPVTGTPLPVFVADYVLMGYGTGAIMAVPGQDERDWEFAEVFDLPIVRTVAAAARASDGKAYTGDGPAINSAIDGLSWTGWTSPTAKARDDRVAGGGTGAGAARSPTGCATGCSAGSATGASRSRSSTTRPACRSRCPSRCCRSSCPRPTTSRRSRSRPTTPTRRPSRRWAG